MSRILFLTSDYPENSRGNLYVDLIDEFINHGHEVDVITPLERRYKRKTSFSQKGKLSVLYIKSLNLRGNVNLIEKGIATLSTGYIYNYAINRFHKNVKYDMVICATLPITYAPVMRKLKKLYGTFAYLLHKDFFPQSALDLELFGENSLNHRLFRSIEKKLYQNSDKIGVMSEKNIEFITTDNPDLNKAKVEICPNGIIPSDSTVIDAMKSAKAEVRKLYQIPEDATVFIYGGNISRAQGIEFIIDIVRKADTCKNAYFVFVGNGNEFDKLKKAISECGSNNVCIIDYLPKQQYDALLAVCDVGLVFLDYRFRIANIPSRSLSYYNMGLPILAATDGYTDFKEVIEKNEIGLWVSSNRTEDFLKSVETFTQDRELRNKMGVNSRKYMDEHATAASAYEVIMKHIKKEG